MVREMIGGCCVCLDERGWNENPLVYCDGTGCSVAVHQACYGIVKVPSGPWFCCKCRSQERVARVKCELCPKKDGALKRTDTGGWAHVVCALYIPEVRFGDVSTMEPIIFSSVPHDRFMKTCYICEERNKESKTSSGACMNCHKTGCKLSFHVTCAQSKRQLCEEASVNGHVQYVGYCTTHWQKRLKNSSNNNSQSSISTSISENEHKKGWKEKKPRNRTESSSSTHSMDILSPVKSSRGRKPKNLDVHSNENNKSQNNNSLLTIASSTTVSNDEGDEISPARGDEATFSLLTGTKTKASMPNGQAKQRGSNNSKSQSFSVNGILNGNDKSNLNSPLNTPVHNNNASKDKTENVKSPTDLTDHSDSDSASSAVKDVSKKRKLTDKDRLRKKQKLKTDKEKDSKNFNSKEKKKKDKTVQESGKKKEKEGKTSDKKKKLPQPSQLGLLENGKVSSWEMSNPKTKETPDNFQAFLEYQWNQSAQFVMSKAQHFDVASLLGCLHQLKSDNMKLEKKLSNLQSRKDRLLGLNARLAASFPESSSDAPDAGKNKVPLSAMLSKLNQSTLESEKTPIHDEDSSPNHKKNKLEMESPEKLFQEDHPVPSPDLAMLAATSAKFDNRMSREKKHVIESKKVVTLDEKAPIHSLSPIPGSSAAFRQTSTGLLGQTTSLLNGVLNSGRRHPQENFSNEV